MPPEDAVAGRPILALVGPTACGKTRIAIELARKFERLELVSIDSMTVYRSMDVGTAKPSLADLNGVRYHMLNTVDPWEEYSVSQFQHDARMVLEGISNRGGVALLVGGTGLYYQALVDGLQIPGRWPVLRASLEEVASSQEGVAELFAKLVQLDPNGAARMQPNNSRRIVRALEVTIGSGIPFSLHGPGLFATMVDGVCTVGIDLPRGELYESIGVRLGQALDSGWVEEVKRIAEDPRGMSRTASQALGYRELLEYVRGSCTLEEARQAILVRTRRFARRQIAWFRRDQRIAWFTSPEMAKMELVSILSSFQGSPMKTRMESD